MSIKIRNLTVTFKNGVTAVNHADLEIPSGVFGLLGENGAGKTTLMRVLTTALKPTAGEVTLNGIPYSESNYNRIRSRIGYLPQEIDLYPNLTVQECLEYMGELSGVEIRECRRRIGEYLERTSLTEHRRKKMRQLSGGMKRRVGLIQALLNEPEFLVVEFSENRTVLFSTHVVEDLAATCSRLAVMKKGNFLYSGSVRELLGMVRGKVWDCCVSDEEAAGRLERAYLVSAKQYADSGVRLRIISEKKPQNISACMPCEATLEDAYIYVSNRNAQTE